MAPLGDGERPRETVELAFERVLARGKPREVQHPHGAPRRLAFRLEAKAREVQVVLQVADAGVRVPVVQGHAERFAGLGRDRVGDEGVVDLRLFRVGDLQVNALGVACGELRRDESDGPRRRAAAGRPGGATTRPS